MKEFENYPNGRRRSLLGSKYHGIIGKIEMRILER